MTQRTPLPSSADSNWLRGLIKNLRLGWRLFRDPLVPGLVKAIPVAAFAYVLLPFDFLPDAIIGLGQLDDLGVCLLGLTLFINLCPLEIVRRHLAEMSSVRASYRVVEEEGAEPPGVAGYLDVEHRVLPGEPSAHNAAKPPRDD